MTAVDTDTHRVWIDGEPVHLTAMEHRLLAFLVTNPQTAFTRRQLLREVWGYDVVQVRAEYDPLATVSVHIRRLRRKIEADPAHPTALVTVWGSGYYYDPNGSRLDNGLTDTEKLAIARQALELLATDDAIAADALELITEGLV